MATTSPRRPARFHILIWLCRTTRLVTRSTTLPENQRAIHGPFTAVSGSARSAGEDKGTQRKHPAEQRTANGGAQIGELVEAIGARKAQKIQAEQRTQKNDKSFEAPLDGGGVPLHGDDAGAEDGDAVESRHESADDRFGHGAAKPRRDRASAICRSVEAVVD